LRVSDLSKPEFIKLVSDQGVSIKTGPFVVNIQSPIKTLQDNLFRLYQHNHVAHRQEYVDFNIRIAPPKSVRAFWRPQAYFYLDDRVPFKPLPYSQAFPMLEWGMNWCVSNHAHQYLIIHAAVIERNGQAILMPAPPGSGKSTLCAGLVSRGWHLLSDELALFSVETGKLVSLARPVNLKNESIDVMQRYAPEATFSARFPDTSKGTVSLMAAPAESVDSAQIAVPLRHVIFPQYDKQSTLHCNEISPAEGFLRVVENAFNYSILGLQGFELLIKAMDKVPVLSLEYSELDTAIDFFNGLVDV